MFNRLAIAAALGLAASPVLAATVAEVSGTFTLEAVGDVPSGIVIDAQTPVTSETSQTRGAQSSTTTETFGFTTPDTSEQDRGELTAIASTDTTGGGFDNARAGAFVELPLFVSNTSDDFLTVTGLLKYDLTATVTTDAASTDDIFASLLLEFIIGGGVIFSQEVFADAGSPSDSAVGEFEVPLTLPGNFGAPVSLVATARVFSQEVSPVPLPAGLPLLAAALGGMALLRRRAAA